MQNHCSFFAKRSSSVGFLTLPIRLKSCTTFFRWSLAILQQVQTFSAHFFCELLSVCLASSLASRLTSPLRTTVARHIIPFPIVPLPQLSPHSLLSTPSHDPSALSHHTYHPSTPTHHTVRTVSFLLFPLFGMGKGVYYTGPTLRVSGAPTAVRTVPIPSFNNPAVILQY
jgi:hypothetical protein